MPGPAIHIDLLRTQALSHPLVLFALSFVLCRLASWLYAKTATLFPLPRPELPPKVPASFPEKVPASFSVGLAVFAIVGYLMALVGYAMLPVYFDHVEPAIAAIGWAVMRGQEAYPGPESAEVYGLPYGPLLYLFNGLTMTLVGPSIASSKVAGVLGAGASLAILVLAVRRAQPDSWPHAARWTVVLYLMFGVTAAWVRAEPLLLLCSSLAVLSLTLPAPASAVIAGVALGAGLNLKISAAVYLAPALLTLWTRTGVRHAVTTIAVAALTAAIPFVLFQNVSVAGYLYWMQTAAAHGLRPGSIPTSLEWAVFILIPTLDRTSSSVSSRAQLRVLRWVVTVCVLLSVPFAAKHGTGFYHFLPFVPAVIFAAGDLVRGERRTGHALVVACLLAAALQVPDWVARATALPAREIAAEIQAHVAKHAGSAAVGYSTNYRLSFFRPLLIFSGHPYLLDSAAIMDRHWSGTPFPSSAVDAIRACRIDFWLMPAGGPPFTLPNVYQAEGSVFPEDFRHAFQEHYRVVESGRWFDVWRCRR